MHDRPAAERSARYLWAAGHLRGEERVLDAACGAGWGTALLAERAGTAVGVDFSPAAIAAARRGHSERARFLEGDLRDLPLDDGEFDRVVCFEALAQVAEPQRAIDELCRVLRPGGVLFVSLPNPAVYPPGNPLQLSETSVEELERLLRARFANVALHRQQGHFASLLGSAELVAQAGGEVEIAARVAKLSGGPAGKALHVVAVAGDGELPPAPAWLALGEDDEGEERQQLREWQARAVRAEAEVCALQRKLRELQS